MNPKTAHTSRSLPALPFPRGRSAVSSLAALVALAAGANLGHAQVTPAPGGTDSDEDVFVLDEFVVSGIRESLIEGVEIKRNSFQMVDALIAEDIGKFPDNNLVEALQRVPGVQVTDRASGEVSTVSIRGLNDIATTVNGRNIFTGTGRSVALQDVPASLLNRVDVYKTRSAAELEQGIAGVIDIKTQRPFYFDGQRTVIAARGIYQELADSIDPNISALFSNTWDLRSGGRFGALVNLSYAETNYRDQSITAGAMVPFLATNTPEGWVPYERVFITDDRASEDPIWQAGTDAGLSTAAGSTININGQPYEYVLARDAVFGNTVDGHRERPAANVVFQFAPNDDSEYTFEAFYNGYRNESFSQLHFSFADWWGSLGDNPAANVELYPGTNIVKSRENVGFPFGFQSGDLTVGRTDSYLYALGGAWNIGDNLKLNADLSYQDTKYEGQFLAMRLERVHSEIDVDFNSGGGLPSWNFGDSDDLTSLESWTVGQLWDNADKSEGDAIELLIDGEYATRGDLFQAIKFGLRYDDRGARFADRFLDEDLGYVPFLGQPLTDYPQLEYLSTDYFDGRSNVPSSFLVPNAHYTWQNHDEVLSWYGLPSSSTYTLTENFNIDEVTMAAYAMAEFRTDLFGRKLDGQFGVRYVNVDTDMQFAGATASTSTDDLLPSFTARYDITPDFRARFSYGETLRRPNFGDLNPNINYVADVTNIGYGTASGGNPNLRATTSKNYDLSFEYYLGQQAGAVYTTLFKRKIDGLVVSFRNRINYEGYDYILSQPDNASNGELEGIEFGWVYFPEELPGLLDGFGLQASYTILESSQDIPITNDAGEVVGTDTTPFFGVSDSSYSVVLAYERQKWNSRLSYVWREDWLNNNEAALFANPLGVWRKPQKSLDFQFTYNVNENLKLTFDATNLTDEIYQSYYVYPETHNFGNWLISRTFALGARYSF